MWDDPSFGHDPEYEEDKGGYEIESYQTKDENGSCDGPGCGEDHIDERGVRHVGAMGQSTIDARMNMLPPKMDEDDGEARTGPKGVLADYKRAQANVAKQRLRDRILQERQVQRQANGHLQIQMAAQQKAAEEKQRGDDSDDSSGLEDSDDEEFMKKYKAQRIEAVQNSLPTFGTHDRYTMKEFANFTKHVHELTTVICVLYQNDIEDCVRLNLCCEALAPQFPYVKFCRMRSKDAISNYIAAGLPTLLVYRGGEMIKSFIRFTDEIKGKIDDLSVAQAMANHELLHMPTVWMAGSSTRDDAAGQLSESDDD